MKLHFILIKPSPEHKHDTIPSEDAYQQRGHNFQPLETYGEVFLGPNSTT